MTHLTDAQDLAIKKFEKAWIVDTNLLGEPIIYTHYKGNVNVEEYVIAKDGELTHTGTYPFTIKLRNELKEC